MKSGYKILWTDHAISELKATIEYLEANWTERELRKFAAKLDHTIPLAGARLHRVLLTPFQSIAYIFNS